SRMPFTGGSGEVVRAVATRAYWPSLVRTFPARTRTIHYRACCASFAGQILQHYARSPQLGIVSKSFHRLSCDVAEQLQIVLVEMFFVAADNAHMGQYRRGVQVRPLHLNNWAQRWDKRIDDILIIEIKIPEAHKSNM